MGVTTLISICMTGSVVFVPPSSPVLKLRNAAASLMEAIYLPYIHSPSFLNKITFAVYPAENYISQLPLQKEVANET